MSFIPLPSASRALNAATDIPVNLAGLGAAGSLHAALYCGVRRASKSIEDTNESGRAGDSGHLEALVQVE